jgi:hypothetical protein
MVADHLISNQYHRAVVSDAPMAGCRISPTPRFGPMAIDRLPITRTGSYWRSMPRSWPRRRRPQLPLWLLTPSVSPLWSLLFPPTYRSRRILIVAPSRLSSRRQHETTPLSPPRHRMAHSAQHRCARRHRSLTPRLVYLAGQPNGNATPALPDTKR